MHPIRDHQVNIPVNPSAGIPASAGHSVFDHCLHQVFFTESDKFGGINIKITVAIGTLSRIGMIDIDKCILINSFKFQPHIFIFVRLIHQKFLGIITVLFHKKTVPAPVRLPAVSGPCHRSIMWQRNRLSVILPSMNQGIQGASSPIVINPAGIKACFQHLNSSFSAVPFLFSQCSCILLYNRKHGLFVPRPLFS